MRLRFTVYLAESMVLQPTSDKDIEVQVSEQVTEQVTEQVRHLLFCLKDQTLGGREAMDDLGLNHRPTFLYDYLKPAIQGGLVEMTQPNSPKSPTQKYRLTEKGRSFVTTK